MEATTVLGRVTSAAPRERTMYRPPPSRFSSISSPKYTAAVNQEISLSIMYVLFPSSFFPPCGSGDF